MLASEQVDIEDIKSRSWASRGGQRWCQKPAKRAKTKAKAKAKTKAKANAKAKTKAKAKAKAKSEARANTSESHFRKVCLCSFDRSGGTTSSAVAVQTQVPAVAVG